MRVRTDWNLAVADESAHPDSHMEWWFVQGYYQAAGSDRREFMASFFRLATWDARHRDGFSFLVSVLDPASGRKEYLSQIDPRIVSHFLHFAPRMRKRGLSRHLVDAFVDEIRACGPPRTVRLEQEAADLSSHPFAVRWSDFSLSQTESAFRLEFAEPESRRRCSFRLEQLHSRIQLDGIRILGAQTMEYVSYPCLGLSGTVGGVQVEGRAWMDHQWGNLGWFVALGEHVMGWDWFGVNLDDGTDVLLMTHRNMRDRRPVDSHLGPDRSGREALAAPFRTADAGSPRHALR